MKSAGFPLFPALTRMPRVEKTWKLHTGVLMVFSRQNASKQVQAKQLFIVIHVPFSGAVTVSLVFLVLQKLAHEV